MLQEQIRDGASVGESADTYALGVTFYYLLTEQHTFDFPAPAEVAEFQKSSGNVEKVSGSFRGVDAASALCVPPRDYA
jgi:hypothetical protein